MSKIKLFDYIKGIVLHGTQDVTAQGGIKKPKYSLVGTTNRLVDVEDMTTYFDKHRHIDQFKATIKVYHIDELVDTSDEDYMIRKTAGNATVIVDCYTIDGKYGVSLEDTHAINYHKEYTTNEYGEVTITIPTCDIYQVYAKKSGYGAAPRQVYRQVNQDIELCLLPITNNFMSDRPINYSFNAGSWKYHNLNSQWIENADEAGGHNSLNTLQPMTCYYIKNNTFYNPSIDTWVGDRSWDIAVENLPNIDGLLIIDEDASFVVLPKDTTFIPWSGKNLNVIDNPCYHNGDEINGENATQEVTEAFLNDYNGNLGTQAVVLNWGTFEAAQWCDNIELPLDGIIQQSYLPTESELMLASMAHKLVLRKIFKVPNSVDNLWRHYDPEDPDAEYNRWYWSICQYSPSSAWGVNQYNSDYADWNSNDKYNQNAVLACASLIL